MFDADEAIAVVGLAAKVPGAHDVEEYWLNLVRGRESVTALTDDELRGRGVPQRVLDDPAYVKAAAAAPDPEFFDATLFGMTAREAQTCDPQIRMFLEAAHAAIENAGYDPATLNTGAGVFASAGPPFYAEQNLMPHRDIADSPLASVMTLNHGGYIATMASYKLDLRGPSVTVQTACSSTLVALHMAGQSLRMGDCDVAVVGGADVEFPLGHGYRWTPGTVLSRDGHCRPFDAAADGTVFGGGACAVVVKRLADALADRDHISAVIRGTAVNNDGADKVSFGAPSPSGQTAVVMEAMALAGVRPEEISYVEAHGTGTALGDPIEVAALSDAYAALAGARLPAASCAIGSVKGNIGHLGPVAGLAGFIKTVLALEREQLPPSINFSTPNPRLELPTTPFRVQDRLEAWPRQKDRPRRASVSSMGIGGSNVHMVLEEAPAQAYTPHTSEPRVLVWSAPDADAERTVRDQLAASFTRRGEQVFADTAATLQHGRTVHPVRAAAVCSSAHEAARTLGSATGRVVTTGGPVREPRPVHLLFPGQGSQQVAMARGPYQRIPAFARALDDWFDLLQSPDLPLRDCWLGTAGAPDITETVIAQPLLFAVESALAQLWQEAGVRPDVLLGHSIGELVAATVAGIFTPDDAAKLVLARARAMRDFAAGGGMLAVATTEAAVADLLDGTVAVSVVNEPEQTVLSGSDRDLAEVAALLAERGVSSKRLRTSGAFHTPLLRPAADAFEQVAAGVVGKPPAIPVVSAATGRPISASEAADPAFWARQLVTPVRFADALDVLLQTDDAIVVETGPGRVLTGIARRHQRVRSGHADVVGSLPQRSGDDDADLEAMLSAAAHLWTGGHDLDWQRLGQARPRHRVPVPGYPYQRKRYWIDPPTATAAVAPVTAAVDEPQSPYATVQWTPSQAGPRPPDRHGATAVLFLPAEKRRALDVVLAAQRAGMRTVRVRPAESWHSGDEFGVRPGSYQDIARVFAELAGRETRPDVLIHAFGAAAWEPASVGTVQRQLDLSFSSLHAIVQHGLRPRGDGRLPALVCLTTGAADVSGADSVEPVKGTLPAAVRTLVLEIPWLSCRLIDLSANTPIENLRDELCRDGEPMVALRGRTRWLPSEQPLHVEPGEAEPIRRNGVYVITGGLGGLGLATLKRFAATGACPRIALLGRTVPPEGAELDRLPAAADEWTTRVTAAVREATAMGAEVRMVACDVGDVRQVRRALDVVTARFGPVNGLLHLAGVAGDGVLQGRRPEQAAQVLRPKVLGTYALAEAFTGRPALDFAVLFSSRAAVDGLIGSGDYAAANGVLDLFARTPGLPADRVLSVNFPSWTTVGMASRELAARAAARDAIRWESILDPGDWMLAEHRAGDRPLLPGTGHLELVLRAYGQELPGSGPVILTDAAFVTPLYVSARRRVRVEFTADGSGHRWVVTSRTADDPDAAWARHVTGRVERQEVDPAALDLAVLRNATTARPAPDLTRRQGSFTLGPRWQSVRELRTRDDDRLVTLRLPEQFAGDLDTHPLHPALLDLATAAARDDDDPPAVPLLYARMVVLGPLPAEVTSHVRRRSATAELIVADVDVADAHGRVLVSIEGFTMRHHGAASGEIRPAAPVSAGDEPVVGIDPATGTDMLLALLAAGTPEQVVVRPFRDGRPARSAPAGADVTPVESPPATDTDTFVAVQSTPADRSPVGERLRTLWGRTLGVEDIANDDDFFDLGGDSLSAIDLMAGIRDTFGVELTIGTLFERSTLAELITLVEQGRS